jgi:hypothetical protein
MNNGVGRPGNAESSSRRTESRKPSRRQPGATPSATTGSGTGGPGPFVGGAAYAKWLATGPNGGLRLENVSSAQSIIEGMTTALRRYLSMNLKKACRHRRRPFARQAAYIGRLAAVDPRTAVGYDFSGKSDIEAWGLMGFAGTLKELIEEVSSSERRDKAVEGRELTLALAHELSAAQRLALVRKCVLYLIRKFKVAVFFALHPPAAGGDQRNWHAHILFTSRKVVNGVRLGEKTRELDSLVTGGRHVEEFRAWWTGAQNEVLRAGGHFANLEYRSLERLGIEGNPGRHLGERRSAIRRRRAPRRLPTPMGQTPSRPRVHRPLPIPLHLGFSFPSTQSPVSLPLALLPEGLERPVQPPISELAPPGSAGGTKPIPLPIPVSFKAIARQTLA